MEKYLGNKTNLLPLIEEFVASRIPNARAILDAFAGTNNVARYFRGRGWSTGVCDANRFSYVLAKTYLSSDDLPSFSNIIPTTQNKELASRLKVEYERSFRKFGPTYLPSATSEECLLRMTPLIRALSHLQELGDINERPGIIFNYFTKHGNNSSYVSLRGTSGQRNYFSASNALFLDGVLSKLRQWYENSELSNTEIFILLACVIEEVVITANVSGTFHDFNREKLWPNAHQSFFLRLPLISHSKARSEIVNADTLRAISEFSEYDVCYIDPPYNFRQYNSYYHLLNFLAAYPFLEDLEGYIMNLAHVRGQNPDDDFSSDFCFRDRFISSLKNLVCNSKCEHIILSYYGGRNHWNHWSSVSEPTDEGLHELSNFFGDKEVFSSSEIVPALDIRRNYQSRVGEQKKLVHEYLFHGVVNRNAFICDAVSAPLAANTRWGLHHVFENLTSPRNQGIY